LLRRPSRDGSRRDAVGGVNARNAEWLERTADAALSSAAPHGKESLPRRYLLHRCRSIGGHRSRAPKSSVWRASINTSSTANTFAARYRRVRDAPDGHRKARSGLAAGLRRSG
jgi:hypothetical protein